MMSVTISHGIVILLLLLVQNICGQQGVNNNVVNNAAIPQPKPTYDTAGVNFYSPQPGQQINRQQSSNVQQVPIYQQPQNFQQPGMNQVTQQNQNPLADIFSKLHNVQFSVQKPQRANSLPMVSCGQNFEQAAVQSQNQPGPVNNQQYANQASESIKPTFTFQFVPASPQNMVPDNQQVTNTIPAQYISNSQSQISSQQGPSYYVQSQPTNQQVSSAQSFQTSSGQSQPIIFTMNPQQQAGQSQSVVYTLQPSQTSSRSGSPQKVPQPDQLNIPSNNPMALLMSQLQPPAGNPDIASIFPMLMNSKQEKSSGIKSLLPLILNLLSDKGCGCPHCGCPYKNAEPTINGGYSNQMNYSQQVLADATETNKKPKSVAKIINESSEVNISREPKKYKTNVISDISEEASDEDDDYEVDDD